MEQRICCDCGQTKPLDEFRLRTDTGTRRPFCLSCDLARKQANYRANKAKRRAAGREWYARNATKVYEYNRRYEAANAAKVRAWKKAYRDRQRDPEVARTQTERAALLAVGLKPCSWCGEVRPLADFYKRGGAKHRGKGLLMSWCRFCMAERQRKRGVVHDRNKDGLVRRITRLEIFERDGGRCGICGGTVERDHFEVDHIIPLARGGTHCYENVQVAHIACNRAKGVSLPDGF